ncbi:MAG: PH domain-containing protein [bacterium]|nr:PH domain-containing protein [bacterium]
MADNILRRAEFDARLPKYWLLVSSIGIAATIIGIPFLLIWLLGLGQYVHGRQYASLEAELTGRSLNIRRGFLFRTQKNIPLDKITDLAVNEGPILRYLGLCSLGVETAGGGANTNMGQAQLPGVVDAEQFRDAVLAQRDLVTDSGAAPAIAAAERPQVASADADTLNEIRDSLGRIERLLTDRFSRS